MGSSALLIILVAGCALPFITALLISLPRVRRYIQECCQQMDDRKLTERNTTAQGMLVRLTVVQWVAPLFLGTLLAFIRHEWLATVVLSLLILVVFVGVSARHVYLRIVIITNSELKRRKSEKETDGRLPDSDAA